MTTVPPFPKRFLNWRLIDGRKVPCRRDGTVCDAHDPSNHTDYATAAASGLAVAFDVRAEDKLFFLDFDDCRTPAGEWDAETEAIFKSFAGAWGEVSQSGTGLHIIGRCDPSKLRDRRNKWHGNKREFYTDARFIAFGSTGWQPIGGTARDVDWTDQLLKLVPQREHLGPLPEGRDAAYTGPEEDDELIALMLRSKGGAGAMFGMKATVAQLWAADAPALATHYGMDGRDFDHSSADAALMSHLAFWTGRDMPRMDRLFRRSALVRPKYLDREDYRRDTIQSAARLCKAVYDYARPTLAANSPEAPGGGTYMTTGEQQRHFAGHIYVQSVHRVFVPDGRLIRPDPYRSTYGGFTFQMRPDGTKPTDDAFKALRETRRAASPRPSIRASGLTSRSGRWWAAS